MQTSNDYDFYAGFLSFVGTTTPRDTPEVMAMMELLVLSADELRATGKLTVKPENLALAGRALAGVAAMLQQRILPEVIADQNETGERQVRWVIDTSMAAMAQLTIRSEMTKNGELEAETVTVDLPPPPKK